MSVLLPEVQKRFEEYCEAFAWMPNCSVPDCEFKAHFPGAMCHSHSRGEQPNETLFEYWLRHQSEETL